MGGGGEGGGGVKDGRFGVRVMSEVALMWKLEVGSQQSTRDR